MTGEVSLRGGVMPIGRIAGKLMAAQRQASGPFLFRMKTGRIWKMLQMR